MVLDNLYQGIPVFARLVIQLNFKNSIGKDMECIQVSLYVQNEIKRGTIGSGNEYFCGGQIVLLLTP